MNPLTTSVVPEIGTLRSVGAGGDSPPLATRWMWKRSYGTSIEAPTAERRGNGREGAYRHRATSRLYDGLRDVPNIVSAQEA